MLPVVAGRDATTWQILIYSILVVPISMLPRVLGFASAIYGTVAAICGARLLALAMRLRRAGNNDRRSAQRLFAFSIVYLLALFAALLTADGGSRRSSILGASETPTAVGSLRAESVTPPVLTARGPTDFSRGEV